MGGAVGKQFETERPILRPFEMGDLEDVHTLIYSDLDVTRYYGPLLSREETREWLTYRILEAKYDAFYA